ncbi:sigma-70-like protein [Lachnotalea glycerini]|jgi:RNA polymerase primary sigma factor|uniref:Sigma-70-like protein n=1 Tax=Lachnotalea glycerini TaxID=1763509 RepID=A0A255IT13_9FIRM|nr:sigma-70 domain-containing protein [Lachnotalea glycerini]PXV93467.1 sigma-70-like protein [Lachnotalea glycerini]RDY31805.1 hypothetical protein CG710_007420 [Lachnotalea glycerini]
MSDKIIFRELLNEIGELAITQENKLTVTEIKEFFSKISLSNEQMELVYSYLEANKIEIEGHIRSDKVKLFEESDSVNTDEIKEETEIQDNNQEMKEEENGYLNMYLEELGAIPNMNNHEKIDLYRQVIQGDALAKSKMIQLYLPRVVELSKAYLNKGLPLSDLIQEGNIGLMLTLDEVHSPLKEDQLEDMLNNGIKMAIEEVLEEADTIKIADKQILGRVNYLNEGVKNLEEELGRPVSITELAKYLEMSEDAVRDIVRISDDEIKVKENM